MRRSFACLVVIVSLLSVAAAENQPQQAPPSVFDLPKIQVRFVQLQAAIAQLFQAGNYADGEKACAQVIALIPHEPNGHYNLACALARQGKKDEAFQSLAKAVELGFNDAKHIAEDADFESLRGDERFAKLVEQAKNAKPVPNPWQWKVEPGLIKDGEAWVTEKNTAWDARLGAFRVFFKFPEASDDAAEAEPPPVIKGHGEVGKLLLQWQAEATAAGNRGDLYDNHDGDHSNMAFGQFPQLTRIEFSDAVRQRRLHSGLQNLFLYNAVTIGNSSTALTGGPFWRSQPRLAYTNPRTAGMLYVQYVGNHLYFYPEHRDHDPGQNGDGGYGDVYPANTPYVIISQGSSGSDRAFMDAVACTLAAFHPDVKKKLTQTGTLMPTVQMIFRTCYKTVAAPEDYLTGKAHPTVFDGAQIDALKMVNMAHGIAADATPPMVQLSVVEEDELVVGRDYFATAPRQKLFTTPAAIARIHRTTNHDYRIVVSAEGSRDLNGHKLTWHWQVLRGDAEAIKIRPLNDEGSVAELIVPYHARRPIESGSPMQSNRVDIGVFVDNGTHYSAPGFVTFFSLDNEKRVYNDKQQIESVDYSDHAAGGNYSDPLVALPKAWRDEYRYDEAGQLIGWTRHRGDATEEFTADGALVTQRDDQGRALQARTVRYAAKPRNKQPPLLEQMLADEILTYAYASADDQVGKLTSREKVAPGNTGESK